MIWQRTARWIVAAIGIGCAIAIFWYSRSRPAPPAPPMALQTIDPKVTATGGAGQTLVLRKGKSNITITHAAFSKYDDGRGRFEQVVIEGLDESRFKVEAKVMETGASMANSDEPQTLIFSGGVKLTTDDGLELTGDTANWNGQVNQLTMPGPVTFRKGRMAGTGLGALYERERNSFTLQDRAQAHIDVDKEGHGGADLSSRRMILIRGQHTLLLEDNAKIVGETQTLTSRNATLTFVDDESRVKYLELVDGAKVAANPGTKATRPAMDADRITMSFYEDGATLQHATLTTSAVLTLSGEAPRSVRASWIDLATAPDGQTLTNLQARDRVVVTLSPTADTPGRTITSNLLNATGNEKKGLTEARFEGNPEFRETPAAPARAAQAPAAPQRWGKSVVLVLTLGGQIDAIELARFLQDAEFHDGDTAGDADIAEYDEAKGELRLMPGPSGPRKPSHVSTPDMHVNAVTIRVDTESNDLDAKGTVTTRSKPTANPKPGSLFNGQESIIGSAETLSYTKSSGTAVYTGTPQAQATLRQKDSKVTANRIEYSDDSRNLNASGKVESVLLMGTGEGGKDMKTQTVRADTMAYDDAARTAIYKGAPVYVSTSEKNVSDSKVEGQTVTFRLAEDSQTLKTMRAVGKVWATLSGGYEGVGEVLIYDAREETYTLEGLPGLVAQVKSPGSDNSKSTTAKPLCNQNDGMRLLLNRKTGGVMIPGEGLAPRTTIEIDCSKSLRRDK